MLATMQLEDAGFEVEAIGDGAQALVRAIEDSFQVIIASVETRGVRGLDLASALRGSQTRRDLPIVLMSSDDDPADRQRATDLDVNANIRKGSFDSPDLVATLRQLATAGAA
jgi:two-component system copper resistance phosphate regulon response regulator CusR